MTFRLGTVHFMSLGCSLRHQGRHKITKVTVFFFLGLILIYFTFMEEYRAGRITDTCNEIYVGIMHNSIKLKSYIFIWPFKPILYCLVMYLPPQYFTILNLYLRPFCQSSATYFMYLIISIQLLQFLSILENCRLQTLKGKQALCKGMFLKDLCAQA